MALSDDENLLTEYNQWKAVVEVSGPDTSPQAFLVDRVKSMAVDRIEDAIKYIDTKIPPTAHTTLLNRHAQKIRAILEGTYVKPDESEGTEDSRPTEPKPIQDSWRDEDPIDNGWVDRED